MGSALDAPDPLPREGNGMASELGANACSRRHQVPAAAGRRRGRAPRRSAHRAGSEGYRWRATLAHLYQPVGLPTAGGGLGEGHREPAGEDGGRNSGEARASFPRRTCAAKVAATPTGGSRVTCSTQPWSSCRGGRAEGVPVTSDDGRLVMADALPGRATGPRASTGPTSCSSSRRLLRSTRSSTANPYTSCVASSPISCSPAERSRPAPGA